MTKTSKHYENLLNSYNYIHKAMEALQAVGYIHEPKGLRYYIARIPSQEKLEYLIAEEFGYKHIMDYLEDLTEDDYTEAYELYINKVTCLYGYIETVAEALHQYIEAIETMHWARLL